MLKRLLLRKTAKLLTITGFPCEISFVSFYSQEEAQSVEVKNLKSIGWWFLVFAIVRLDYSLSQSGYPWPFIQIRMPLNLYRSPSWWINILTLQSMQKNLISLMKVKLFSSLQTAKQTRNHHSPKASAIIFLCFCRSFSLYHTDHTLENKLPPVLLSTPQCALGGPEKLFRSQGTDPVSGGCGGLPALTAHKGTVEHLGT